MNRTHQSNPIKILVVEDNFGDFLLLKESIYLSAIQVSDIQLADTLSAAIGYLQKNKPDIIFLDLYLPDSSGLDSFNRLKEYVSGTPVIILSGLSDTKISLEAIADGAQDYLAKGEFDEKLLEKTILYSIERKQLEVALEESRIQQQRAITEATVKGQENEREQLGKELHDNINQILATSKLYLDYALSEPIVKKDALLKSKEFIVMATAEIRKLSHSLLPPSLEEFGLTMALDELVCPLSATDNFCIEKKWDNFQEQEMSKDQKLTIYRIAQEQLNNIIKHAAAKNVLVALRLVNEDQTKGVELVIKDDGKGFDTAQKKNGVGLRNIASRAGVFGGKVIIHSTPGHGCELKVIFPDSSLHLVKRDKGGQAA
jgi:signal transduction histidine kinase